jgi:hypothetical protein
MVWHVDKYKITFKLVINHWTNEILVTDICYTDVIYAFWVWAFRHIQEYYSPQNISTIKYLFMKNVYKTKITNSRKTSRGSAVEKHWYSTLLSFNFGPRWERMVSTTPAALTPVKRPSTHCTGGLVGPRTGLDGSGKSCPHRDSIPGPSSP